MQLRSESAEHRPTDKSPFVPYNGKTKGADLFMYESTLYIDLQQVKPACFCPICGSERYWPGCICIRCEAKKEQES